MFETFKIVLNQMMVLFLFIMVGYFLRKKSILPDNADNVISKLEVNVIVPCLSFITFANRCTLDNLIQYSNLLIYGAGVLAAAIIICYILAPMFTKDEYVQNIYRYALAVANFSYMGNAVVLGMYGEEMLFKYMLFTLPLNLMTYSWGAYILTPKEAGSKFSIKSLINPITVSLALGMVFGLTGLTAYLPSFVSSTISSASSCMGPLAMILTGFVIGNYPLKDLITDKKVYIASLLRLIVIPGVFMVVLKMINAPTDILRLTLFGYACPLGLNTVVFPAVYGKDTMTGARMASISHIISIITIPLMYMIFVG